MNTIVIDELYRQHHKTLVSRTVKVLVSLSYKNLVNFSRIALRRVHLQAVGIVIHDSCLCCIGYDVTECIQFCKCRILFIPPYASTASATLVTIRLMRFGSPSTPAQLYGILTFLLVKTIQASELDRLYQHDIAIESALLVRYINHIIHKSTKEISLSKL